MRKLSAARNVLHRRFQRISDYELKPKELVRLTTGGPATHEQTEEAFERIRLEFLNNDELVHLELLLMDKNDRQVAEILGMRRLKALKRRHRLYQLIAAYGWWLQNDVDIYLIISRRLSPFHSHVIEHVAMRRRQREIARRLEVNPWTIYKKTDDCIRLMSKNKDFMTFLHALRLGYVR